MHLDLGNTRQKTKTLTSSGKYNFTLPFEIHCCTKFLSTTFMSLMNPKENMLIHNMPIHYYYWAAQTIWTDVQHRMNHAPQQHRNDRTDPMTPPPHPQRTALRRPPPRPSSTCGGGTCASWARPSSSTPCASNCGASCLGHNKCPTNKWPTTHHRISTLPHFNLPLETMILYPNTNPANTNYRRYLEKYLNQTASRRDPDR